MFKHIFLGDRKTRPTSPYSRFRKVLSLGKPNLKKLIRARDRLKRSAVKQKPQT